MPDGPARTAIDDLVDPVRPADPDATASATERLASLAVPPGSLGRLGDLGVRLAGIAGTSPVRAGADLTAARIDDGADLIATGDLGIANTTASACLIAAFTGRPSADVTGPGAANPPDVIAHKAEVVRRALARHGADRDPLATLASLGGAEHAALVGVVLAAAARRVPVVLDGVIAVAAALATVRLCPAAADVLIAGHRSAEPGATAALEDLGLDPLIDLALALGEGTGAVLAVPVVRSAAAVIGEIALLVDVAT